MASHTSKTISVWTLVNHTFIRLTAALTGHEGQSWGMSSSLEE